MWKPSEVVAEHRRRAVVVWSSLLVGIVTYSGWLLYKAARKMEAPDTSFELTNVVYKYPDLWVCPYVQYGCDEYDLEPACAKSAWNTTAGSPDALFYPRDRLDQLTQTKTEELEIEAVYTHTNFNSAGEFQEDGKGHCIIFETSAATAFVGQERDSHEFLDYILLDMYWYPGGKDNSSTCVPDGEEWVPHSEWVYAFLSDPEDPAMISTGIHLPYSCITEASNSYVFNSIGVGLTTQKKFMSDDISSYKAISTNFGIRKDVANSSITKPYARLSLELKQQSDSWEIITEINPFEFAEMFGNIGGFWDLLLILWPIFFVATTQQDPHLKSRTLKKSVVRGAERAAGIAKVIPRPGPMRRSGSTKTGHPTPLEDDLEEQPSWEAPSFERQGSVLRRSGTASRLTQRG